MSGSILSRMADGLSNVITGLGTNRDARAGRQYHATTLTQQTVDAAYRGSGMLRKVIDIPALDMVREWRDWQADNDQIEALEAEERRLGIRAKVRQAEVLRGLGGGALILGVPGDPAMPANPRNGTGSLAYVHVVSRWQLQLGDMIYDPRDPLYGGPAFFRMQGLRGAEYRLHPSRVVCFRGDPIPTALALASADDAFWGEGRIARVMSAALNLDETLESFAAMVKDARNIDIGVPKLLEMVSTDAGEAMLLKRLSIMAQGSSIINATVYDKGDAEGKGGESIDRHQMTWTGIPELIRAKAEALSAVSDIPMTRLWGKSAEGMSASGDSQQRDWNKMVKARQELDLRGSLDQLDAFLIPSALGSVPADVWWQFAPLDSPSEKEETDRFKIWVEAAEKVQLSGAIPDIAFTKGYQNSLTENGWMPGLEGALGELDEATRFGIVAEPDPSEADPSALSEGGDDPSAESGVPVEAVPRRRAANDARFNDATPRTLYVQRRLLNTSAFIAWAKGQGFDTTADDLHVTITYSRTAVDWMKMGCESWGSDDKGELTVAPGGARIVEALGDKGAIVLLFASSSLSWRHEEMIRNGASHDFPEYQPHVTITYAKPDGLDLTMVEPYRGELRFGPEIFEEIKTDFQPGEG